MKKVLLLFLINFLQGFTFAQNIDLFKVEEVNGSLLKASSNDTIHFEALLSSLSTGSSHTSLYGAGLHWNRRLSKRAAINIGFSALSKTAQYLNPGLQHERFSNSVLGWNTTNSFYYLPQGSIKITAAKKIDFEAGYKRLKSGIGKNSLFMNYSGGSMPFAVAKFKGKKLKYEILYAYLQNPNLKKEFPKPFYANKFLVSHQASLSFWNKLNVGVFESVVWQAKDTSLARGFDISYLNPVAFFRPIEYSNGSSDNVLLGAFFDATVFSHFTFYGQLLLDEFLLKEVKAKDGWWANKFGGLFGAKFNLKVNEQTVQLKSEFTAVRPYTYAHATPYQSYSNQGFSLAHPLGANFTDWHNKLKITNKYWEITASARLWQKGYDSDTTSFGGDIFQVFANKKSERGNTLLQGNKNSVYLASLEVTRKKLFLKKFDVFALLQARSINSTKQAFFMLGIKTNFPKVFSNF